MAYTIITKWESEKNSYQNINDDDTMGILVGIYALTFEQKKLDLFFVFITSFTHRFLNYKQDSEVIGGAYFPVCSQFITDQARNPSYKMSSLKIKK